MKHLNDSQIFDLLESGKENTHLADCESCEERYNSFKAFDSLLAKKMEKPVKKIDFADSIMQRVEASSQKKDLFDYTLVASIALLCAAAVYLFVQFALGVDYSPVQPILNKGLAFFDAHKLIIQGVSTMLALVLADWLIQLRKKRQKI